MGDAWQSQQTVYQQVHPFNSKFLEQMFPGYIIYSKLEVALTLFQGTVQDLVDNHRRLHL